MALPGSLRSMSIKNKNLFDSNRLKEYNSQMQCVIDPGLDSCLNKPGEKSIMKNWDI